MVSRRAVMLMLLPLVGCASLRARVFGSSEAEARYARAVAAVDRADFSAAKPDLEWLVGRCRAGEEGRRALLLMASAELDVRNPGGSAAEAARLARAYLELPWGDETEVPIARSLYLLALDLEAVPGYVPHQVSATASAVPLAARFDHCDGGGEARRSEEPPVLAGPTTGQRFANLRFELDARSDSLSLARASVSAQALKIEELEAEIERIRKLLRGGGGLQPLRRR